MRIDDTSAPKTPWPWWSSRRSWYNWAMLEVFEFPRHGGGGGRGGGRGRGRRFPGFVYGGYYPDYDRALDVEVVQVPPAPWRVFIDKGPERVIYAATLQMAVAKVPAGARVLRAQRWDGIGWREA